MINVTLDLTVPIQTLEQMRWIFKPEELDAILQKEVGPLIGEFILQLVKQEYPPPQRARGSAPSPIHTDKQKRWWWYWMNQIAQGQQPPDSLRGWKASYKTVDGYKTLVIDSDSGYKRTGLLVRGIVYEVEAGQGQVLVKVGPNLATSPDANGVESYAKYVIDVPPPEGDQAKYHQGNWKPLVEILEDHQEEIMAYLEQLLFAAINRRMQSEAGAQFS